MPRPALRILRASRGRACLQLTEHNGDPHNLMFFPGFAFCKPVRPACFVGSCGPAHLSCPEFSGLTRFFLHSLSTAYFT